MKIAQTQRQLLALAFDLESHTRLPATKPRRRVFRKPEPTERERLLAALYALRAEAESRLSGEEGVFWWQLPWEVTEEVLCLCLEERKRENGWRFASTYQCVPTEDGACAILLFEEGATQRYATEQIYAYAAVSPYDKAERQKRMEAFDQAARAHRRKQREDFALSNAAFVQSSLTNALYDSVEAYYMAEGTAMEMVKRHNYEQSLYVDTYVEGVSATAAERYRVKGAFAVGVYTVDPSGALTGYVSLDHRCLTVFPEELQAHLLEGHTPGRAFLKLCELLARDEAVRAIPLSLLEALSGAGKTDEEMSKVALQSAAATLFAEKLFLDA